MLLLHFVRELENDELRRTDGSDTDLDNEIAVEDVLFAHRDALADIDEERLLGCGAGHGARTPERSEEVGNLALELHPGIGDIRLEHRPRCRLLDTFLDIVEEPAD